MGNAGTGKLRVDGDRCYKPGDKVSGVYTVDLRSQMKCESIEISLACTNIVYLRRFISSPRCTVCTLELLKDGPKMLSPGVNEFPFEFEIPENTPGSIDYVQGPFHPNSGLVDGTIKVQYKLKAVVSLTSGKISDSLVVNLFQVPKEKPEPFLVQTGDAKEVKTFCCGRKVKVDFEINTDKNIAYAGEKILVSAKVSNLSKMRIHAVNIELVPCFLMKNTQGNYLERPFSFLHPLATVKMEGMDSWETREFGNVALEIPDKLQSQSDSFCGKLVYYVKVTAIISTGVFDCVPAHPYSLTYTQIFSKHLLH